MFDEMAHIEKAQATNSDCPEICRRRLSRLSRIPIIVRFLLPPDTHRVYQSALLVRHRTGGSGLRGERDSWAMGWRGKVRRATGSRGKAGFREWRVERDGGKGTGIEVGGWF